MYTPEGVKLSRIDFPVIDIKIDSTTSVYETDYQYNIPISTKQVFEDFFKETKSFFKIESDLNNDILNFSVEIPAINGTDKQAITKKTSIENKYDTRLRFF